LREYYAAGLACKSRSDFRFVCLCLSRVGRHLTGLEARRPMTAGDSPSLNRTCGLPASGSRSAVLRFASRKRLSPTHSHIKQRFSRKKLMAAICDGAFAPEVWGRSCLRLVEPTDRRASSPTFRFAKIFSTRGSLPNGRGLPLLQRPPSVSCRLGARFEPSPPSTSLRPRLTSLRVHHSPRRMSMMLPNKITGPNAGGPRRFPILTPLAARVGQFWRSV